MSYDRTCKAHSLVAFNRPDADRHISDHYRRRFMGDGLVNMPWQLTIDIAKIVMSAIVIGVVGFSIGVP